MIGKADLHKTTFVVMTHGTCKLGCTLESSQVETVTSTMQN
jgi:hypothetical protein